MANAAYTEVYDYLLSQALLTATIRALLVDADLYTYAAGHTIDDIPAGAILSTSPAMIGKAVTGGDFSVASFVFADPAGDTDNGVIVYYVDSTPAVLIGLVDTGTNFPIPVTTGEDVNVTGHVVCGLG